MANWSVPVITDLYTNFLAYLKARDDDAGRMNDSRTTAATNLPDYSKRWNATSQTFQNWLSATWGNLILAIAGGGTGASTTAGARTNLNVYSTDEVDALLAAGLSYAESTLSSSVSMTSGGVMYDGPSVALASGTWFISGSISLAKPTTFADVIFCAMLRTGATNIVEALWRMKTPAAADASYITLPLNAIVVVGGTTTYKLSAHCSEAGGVIAAGTLTTTATYIRALRIA